MVQKAGEIIPEIVEVLKEKRPEGTQPYHLPEQCPVCGAPVARDEDGARIRCTGAECPAQRLRHLVHFASRDAMDIEGLGPRGGGESGGRRSGQGAGRSVPPQCGGGGPS